MGLVGEVVLCGCRAGCDEGGDLLLDVVELFLGEALMTGEDESAAHDLLGVLVACFGEAMRDLLEGWLFQDVAREDGAGLNVGGFEEERNVLADERRAVTNDNRECQPDGVGTFSLLR